MIAKELKDKLKDIPDDLEIIVTNEYIGMEGTPYKITKKQYFDNIACIIYCEQI